jgi:hypothetical protein
MSESVREIEVLINQLQLSLITPFKLRVTMDFETLDAIADSYIPLLAISFIVGLAARAVRTPADRRFLC